MATPAASLEVSRGPLGGYLLRWTYPDAVGVGIAALQTTVYRSASYTGPYAVLAGPFDNVDWYVDSNVERNVLYYYYVVHTLSDAGSVRIPDYGGSTLAPSDTLEIAAIRRKMYHSLHLAQTPVMCYPAKTSGARCVCYDKVKQRHSSHCITCYGTGYIGGFFNPIVLPAKITPSSVDAPATGRQQVGLVRLSLPGVFQLRQGDLVIDGLGRRWTLNDVSPLQYLGSTVAHTAVGAPVSNDSLMQKVPVDLSLLRRPEKLVVERTT